MFELANQYCGKRFEYAHTKYNTAKHSQSFVVPMKSGLRSSVVFTLKKYREYSTSESVCYHGPSNGQENDRKSTQASLINALERVGSLVGSA